MQKIIKKLTVWTAIFLLFLMTLSGCNLYSDGAGSQKKDGGVTVAVETVGTQNVNTSKDQSTSNKRIAQNGIYTTKEDVALYLYTYKTLPANFITKTDAKKLGWNGGSLERYAKGKCIGGDRFGNYEGKLPKKKGRTYFECDIDTLGKDSRGAKRIIYSNDGYIYYTANHYKTFTELYKGED